MKEENFSHEELSSFCLELSLLIHAGVSLGEGLSLLAEETPRAEDRRLLADMAHRVDDGEPLAAALRAAGRFPVYVCALVEVGERSGRTEEALGALSRYYEDLGRLDRRVRSALTYPAILLVLMLVVIVVLLTKVLPIFNSVYESLGGSLTGVAGGLLALGRGLDAAMPVLCGILALVAAFLAAFSLSGGFRQRMLSLWHKWRGDRGLSRQMTTARFAQALAMGLRSGLQLSEALELAGGLQAEIPAAQARCLDAQKRLEQGEDLSETLRLTGVLPASACRLLALGQRSGTGDAVMEEVARRLTEESEDALERTVGRIEPGVVLVSSLLVGLILLSVMLPLMNIMTAIG